MNIPGNFITHRAAWRSALETAKNTAANEADASYWQHEIAAFDRSFDCLGAIVKGDVASVAEKPATNAAQESREAWARWLRDPNRSHNPNAFALIADLLDGFAEQQAVGDNLHALTEAEEDCIYENDADDGWCGHDVGPRAMRNIFARVFQHRRAAQAPLEADK